MYTSDLQGLFSLLTVSQQSGTLILQPDTQTPAWQASFTLERGQVATSVLTASNRAPVRLEPTQAIAALSKQGTLWWILQSPSSQPGHRSHVASINARSAQIPTGGFSWHREDRPCRMKIAPHPADEWERLLRSIFALIDDKRTVQEIAHILHKSLEDIQPHLQDLYQSGWIGKL